MDLKDDNYFYMYTKLYDSLDNHNYRLAHDLAVILYLSKPTAEFFYSYLYCLTKGIEDFDVEILLRICKDKHLREYLRGLYFAVLQEWSSSKEAFNRALSILNKRNQFHLYYISLEGENVILDMKNADLQMVVSDILTELKIIMHFENPIIIMKQPRPTQDIFRLSYSIRKPEEPGAENKYFIDRAFSSFSDPQFNLAIQEIAKNIKKVYYETDPKTQKEILREDIYKNFILKIQKVNKLLKKVKTPKQTYPIEKYNRIEATIEIDDDKSEYAKKEFVLIPKSKKVPKIIINDFQNTRTREFSLLLFLIYERSQGGKDWLSAILSRSGKYPSEFESLIKVLEWCGIGYSETDEDFWWNDDSRRRWIVPEQNKKADKAGITGDLIELNTELVKNKQGKLKKKRVGKKNGSYRLFPGLRAKIEIPPKKYRVISR